MRKLKILSVVRSMGPGNAIALILEELKKDGHEVRFLLEEDGQAKDKLKVPFELLHDTKELAEIFESFKPDLVISGLSWPRVLEAALDEEAFSRGISIVHVEDFWGAHTRGRIKPDLVVAIDKAAEKLIKKVYPEVKVVLAGFAGISPVTLSDSSLAQIEKIRKEVGGKIILLPDCGPEAESILPIIKESVFLSKTPITLVLKPKPYDGPKHKSGKTWDEVYEEILEPLLASGRVKRVEGPTDEFAMLCDATASGFSSLLIRAACNQKVALTVWTPYVRELLKKETYLEETPLMLLGGFPVIEKPQSLDEILSMSPPPVDLKVFDAKIASEAISKTFC